MAQIYRKRQPVFVWDEPIPHLVVLVQELHPVLNLGQGILYLYPTAMGSCYTSVHSAGKCL